jgi:hypothetical protein
MSETAEVQQLRERMAQLELEVAAKELPRCKVLTSPRTDGLSGGRSRPPC